MTHDPVTASVGEALALVRPELRDVIGETLRPTASWNATDGAPGLFRLPEDTAYLNWAYLGLVTDATEAAAHWAMSRRAEPWRIERRDFFDEVEACRVLFASIAGCRADDVALVPAASYGVAVAKSIIATSKPGRIIAPAEEHYSNFYAWEQLAQAEGWSMTVVPRPEDGDWTRAMCAHIGDDCALVLAPACHWTDGSLFDLKTISAAVKSAGARLVVDITQTLGATSLKLSDFQPDFMVASAYKWLLGPYGLAFLYVAPQYHDRSPLEEHSYHRAGATGRASRVEYTREYAPGARRFDAGQRSNFVTLPHAVAGMAQLLTCSVDAVANASSTMVSLIEEHARAAGYQTTPGPRSGANITALRHPQGWPQDIAQRLSARNVHVSLRGDALRISPSLNNRERDVEQLMAVLAGPR